MIRDLLDRGARLAWIFADDSDAGTALHYVSDDGDALTDTVVEVDGAVASLTDVRAGAQWYEREIRERYGIAFEGLNESRPLLEVREAEELLRAESAEVSTVLYGPIRSGIVESARWIVETAGEDFVDVYPSMFFKRRALEERFEGVPFELAPFVAEHVSGATASSHASAFAFAVETALRIVVPERARVARDVLVEFERVHQHLDALAKLADDGSLSVGSAQTFAAKERVHRLLAAATGNRFARGTICVGGLRFDALSTLKAVCERELDAVEGAACAAVDGLLATQSLLDRLIGTGRLTRETVEMYGGVGPVARGSGVSCDARLHAEVIEEGGDAIARAAVRAREIRASFDLIRAALAVAPPIVFAAPACDAGSGRAIARVESPQGELLYFVRVEAGRIARVAIRSASYANWPLFVPSLPANIFTDFSFIEHSFGLLQAEVDR